MGKGWTHKAFSFAAALALATTIYLQAVPSSNLSIAGHNVMFNPFRDRNPEYAAKNFMGLLYNGHYAQALAALPIDSEHRQSIEHSESVCPVRSWHLSKRVDDAQIVTMDFLGSCDSMGRHARVRVEKRKDQWQVTDYEAWVR